VSRNIIYIENENSTLYIDVESIISIKSYHDDIIEHCPKVKLPWWNVLRWLCISGYDCPQNCDVYSDFMGRPYIITGKRQKMMLFLSSGQNINLDWDRNIYSKWMKFGNE